MISRKAVALWSLFGVTAVVTSVLALLRPDWDRLADLHVYYGAAQTVQAGLPLYEFAAENGDPFTYPPFAALLFLPIGSLPEGVVQVLWLALICAAVIALALALGRVASAPHLIAIALIISAPVQSNLRFGQISIFIVLLALIDGMGLTPARYRGVLVGVAAAIKLTPLLFVLFFLLSRRYRDAGRAALAFVACAAIAFVALPSDSWTFWTEAIRNTSRIGDLASLGNQSVHGLLLRAGVPLHMLPMLWAGLIAVICVIALWRARQLDPARGAVLVGCATVAASPVSWTHHQVWSVLAAMLMIATQGLARRLAGYALLVVMTLSLGSILSEISTTTGLQFLFENARALSVILICVAGLGVVTVIAVRRRAWIRFATTSVATLALFAVMPLPAQADPTFKAYTSSDLDNPRYFFVCRNPSECADVVFGPVNFGIAWEETKVRVSGVVNSDVARLAYFSAAGGAPHDIPLVEIYPGQRGFAFRSASLASGRLIAYDTDGRVLAVIADKLNDA